MKTVKNMSLFSVFDMFQILGSIRFFYVFERSLLLTKNIYLMKNTIKTVILFMFKCLKCTLFYSVTWSFRNYSYLL